MEGEDNNIEVDYNDLSVVVIQIWGLKLFLEELFLEGRLEEFLEEKREELFDHLNKMEYLLNLIYLFIDNRVQLQDVPEVHDNTEVGLAIMKHFLQSLEFEGRYEEFLEEKMDELDDSLNNLEFLLQLIYLFTYEAGLAIINGIRRDCIDNDICDEMKQA